MTPAASSTDLREAGSWTRGQALKNDVIAFAVRGVLALLIPLPPRALRVVGRGIGFLAFVLVPGLRRIARANVTRALPELSSHEVLPLVRRAYAALGEHLGDAVASLDPSRPLDPLPIDPKSRALLDRARVGPDGRPRGVLFASAHLGPWERVAASLVAAGVPMTVLARETYDPRLGWIYDRLRGARQVAAIYRGHTGAPTRIVRTLRAGGVLGVPMDLRSRVPTVEATFLGQEARVPVGPARIALRMGAAVIVGTVAPDPVTGGHHITCTEIPTDDLAPAPKETAEQELTARLATELSRRIRALPDEWVWMHDRFRRNLVD